MHVYDRRLRWSVPSTLPKRLTGRKIDAIDRRSKYLLFRSSSDTLLVHFGMTGSLRAFTDAPPRKPHDHIDILLDSGVTLRYRDPRRFGAMLWLPHPADGHPLLAHLGPEPFDPRCDAAYLHAALRSRSAPIKLALMDNHLIVGVGNIYATESLFRARIRPTTPAKRVSKIRLARLVAEVRATLTEAIARPIPARILRLWARRPAVQGLRCRNPADSPRRASDVVLPAMPAMKRGSPSAEHPPDLEDAEGRIAGVRRACPIRRTLEKSKSAVLSPIAHRGRLTTARRGRG